MKRLYGMLLTVALIVGLGVYWSDAARITSTGGGGVSGWPTVSTTKLITWANSFANAARVEDGNNNGVATYTDATYGPQINCYVAGVENDCNYARLLNASKTFSVLDHARTPIFTITEATGVGTITNMTVDGEGTGNSITLTEERWYAVATCQNATASTIFDTPTSNAPTATCDTGTNTQKGYLAFNDSTLNSFQDHWMLPAGFTGAIDIGFRWKAAATSGAVGWCAQLIRVPDAATSDPAFPALSTSNCVSDTAKGTTLQENNATITGVTCTSCAAGDHVYVRIARDAAGTAVTDSMTGDGLLLMYGRTWRVAH